MRSTKSTSQFQSPITPPTLESDYKKGKRGKVFSVNGTELILNLDTLNSLYKTEKQKYLKKERNDNIYERFLQRLSDKKVTDAFLHFCKLHNYNKEEIEDEGFNAPHTIISRKELSPTERAKYHRTKAQVIRRTLEKDFHMRDLSDGYTLTQIANMPPRNLTDCRTYVVVAGESQRTFSGGKTNNYKRALSYIKKHYQNNTFRVEYDENDKADHFIYVDLTRKQLKEQKARAERTGRTRADPKAYEKFLDRLTGR